MMMSGRAEQRVVVTVGFGARTRGGGVAYASVAAKALPGEVLRVAFACRPLPALHGRDVAYAALSAVAEALFERGYRHVELRTDDPNVPVDLAERRTLPAALTLPYVTLRCKLNRFAAAAVTTAADRQTTDLTARALAEASLDVAA